MKRIIFMLLIIATTFSLKAQYYENNKAIDSMIWVDNAMYDFGEKLEGLQIQHTYRLKNLSKDTLRITHIDQFGGSGLFSASHENIFPGSFFLIDVSFSTSGKNGNFIKSGTIHFSNGIRIILNFKGFVLDRKSQIEKNQTNFYSNKAIDSIIWVDNALHDFGIIQEGEKVKHTFKLKNISNSTISILNNPIENNILTEFSKEPILPNQSFDFTIYFNSSGKAGFQTRTRKINFSNGLSIECGFEIYVVSKFLHKFDSMVSGMETYNFGNIKEGSNVKFDYIFKNTSNDILYIETISTSCGCHFCQFSKEPILPNQYFKVTNNFNASGKSGHQNKIANMIITNKKGYYKSINFELTAVVTEHKEDILYSKPNPKIKN